MSYHRNKEERFVHPVCRQMKELRNSLGMSLVEAEPVTGIQSLVLGSYERGQRQPPLIKVEQVLQAYGYTLVAVPQGFHAVRLPSDIVAELRSIADQIERTNNRDVLGLQETA